jgi:hypothetical protein
MVRRRGRGLGPVFLQVRFIALECGFQVCGKPVQRQWVLILKELHPRDRERHDPACPLIGSLLLPAIA